MDEDKSTTTSDIMPSTIPTAAVTLSIVRERERWRLLLLLLAVLVVVLVLLFLLRALLLPAPQHASRAVPLALPTSIETVPPAPGGDIRSKSDDSGWRSPNHRGRACVLIVLQLK